MSIKTGSFLLMTTKSKIYFTSPRSIRDKSDLAWKSAITSVPNFEMSCTHSTCSVKIILRLSKSWIFNVIKICFNFPPNDTKKHLTNEVKC